MNRHQAELQNVRNRVLFLSSTWLCELGALAFWFLSSLPRESNTAYAQPTAYRLEPVSLEQGVSHNLIYCIKQDRHLRRRLEHAGARDGKVRALCSCGDGFDESFQLRTTNITPPNPKVCRATPSMPFTKIVAVSFGLELIAAWPNSSANKKVLCVINIVPKIPKVSTPMSSKRFLMKIRYYLPRTQFVTIKVVNVLGHEIATLINAPQTGGSYEVIFEPSLLMAGGIYFVRMAAGHFSQTRKMLLVR